MSILKGLTLEYIEQLKGRFWAKVDKHRNPSGCWEWRKVSHTAGYGKIGVAGKYQLAHRVSYELFVGSASGLQVLHACDNRRCVNPEHLFLGTDSDNKRDMVRKGRQRYAIGGNNGNAVLDENKVKEIRQKYIPYKYSSYKLAKEYGLSRPSVLSVINRKTWTHVK